jgi:hypothetical protein
MIASEHAAALAAQLTDDHLATLARDRDRALQALHQYHPEGSYLAYTRVAAIEGQVRRHATWLRRTDTGWVNSQDAKFTGLDVLGKWPIAGVEMCPQPTSRPPEWTQHWRAQQVAPSWRYIVLDIDAKDCPVPMAMVLDRIKRRGPEPWMVINSGSGGVHVWWALNRPVHRDRARQIQLWLAAQYYGDTEVAKSIRPSLRMPGTVHPKWSKSDGVLRLCTIRELRMATCDVEDFAAWVPLVPEGPDPDETTHHLPDWVGKVVVGWGGATKTRYATSGWITELKSCPACSAPGKAIVHHRAPHYPVQCVKTGCNVSHSAQATAIAKGIDITEEEVELPPLELDRGVTTDVTAERAAVAELVETWAHDNADGRALYVVQSGTGAGKNTVLDPAVIKFAVDTSATEDVLMAVPHYRDAQRKAEELHNGTPVRDPEPQYSLRMLFSAATLRDEFGEGCRAPERQQPYLDHGYSPSYACAGCPHKDNPCELHKGYQLVHGTERHHPGAAHVVSVQRLTSASHSTYERVYIDEGIEHQMLISLSIPVEQLRIWAKTCKRKGRDDAAQYCAELAYALDELRGADTDWYTPTTVPNVIPEDTAPTLAPWVEREPGKPLYAAHVDAVVHYSALWHRAYAETQDTHEASLRSGVYVAARGDGQLCVWYTPLLHTLPNKVLISDASWVYYGHAILEEWARRKGINMIKVGNDIARQVDNTYCHYAKASRTWMYDPPGSGIVCPQQWRKIVNHVRMILEAKAEDVLDRHVAGLRVVVITYQDICMQLDHHKLLRELGVSSQSVVTYYEEARGTNAYAGYDAVVCIGSPNPYIDLSTQQAYSHVFGAGTRKLYQWQAESALSQAFGRARAPIVGGAVRPVINIAVLSGPAPSVFGGVYESLPLTGKYHGTSPITDARFTMNRAIHEAPLTQAMTPFLLSKLASEITTQKWCAQDCKDVTLHHHEIPKYLETLYSLVRKTPAVEIGTGYLKLSGSRPWDRGQESRPMLRLAMPLVRVQLGEYLALRMQIQDANLDAMPWLRWCKEWAEERGWTESKSRDPRVRGTTEHVTYLAPDSGLPHLAASYWAMDAYLALTHAMSWQFDKKVDKWIPKLLREEVSLEDFILRFTR